MSSLGDGDRRNPDSPHYYAPPGPASLRPVLERLRHGGDSPPLVPEFELPPPYAMPAQAAPTRDPFALVGRAMLVLAAFAGLAGLGFYFMRPAGGAAVAPPAPKPVQVSCATTIAKAPVAAREDQDKAAPRQETLHPPPVLEAALQLPVQLWAAQAMAANVAEIAPPPQPAPAAVPPEKADKQETRVEHRHRRGHHWHHVAHRHVTKEAASAEEQQPQQDQPAQQATQQQQQTFFWPSLFGAKDESNVSGK